MIVIDNVLISDDIVTRHFVCDLNACLGACCWEGDWGAPLRDEEAGRIKKVWEKVAPHLSAESHEVVKRIGFATDDDGNADLATPLIDNGACAYLIWDGKGIGKCAFEVAYEAGEIDFPKPLSCHLYPIRVQYLNNGTEAWNYSHWDICAPACAHGIQLQVPIYKFLKGPIIRAKGETFYEQLEVAARAFDE